MVRPLLDFPNMSQQKGMEGLLSWGNSSMNNLPVPMFLFIFWFLSIYILSKTEWRMGNCVFFSSFIFFILGMIAQTFVSFNQLVMFIFALGIAGGIIIAFIENAR